MVWYDNLTPSTLCVTAPSQGFSQAFGVKPGGANDPKSPTIISKGSIILRVINIGREPRNINTKQADFDDVKNNKGRLRKRVHPAWEIVHGRVAKELANGDSKCSNGSSVADGVGAAVCFRGVSLVLGPVAGACVLL